MAEHRDEVTVPQSVSPKPSLGFVGWIGATSAPSFTRRLPFLQSLARFLMFDVPLALLLDSRVPMQLPTTQDSVGT